MSLTMGVGDNFKSMDVRLAFEPEVFFWVMSPELEKLHEVTGKLVTTYDDAIFKTQELVHLDSVVRGVENRIQNLPRTWQEHVGTQLKPEKKELYQTVHKHEFVGFLNKFKAVVTEAKESNMAVLFYGD